MARQYGRPGSTLTIDLGEDSRNIVAIAEDVAIHRGIVITEACYHIAAIRSLYPSGPMASAAVVRCVKAALQDTTASQGHQAAHLVPGSITVNERPIWTLADPELAPLALRSAVIRLQAGMEETFALTNVLPAIFNRADSQAEGMSATGPVTGLKALFGSIVQSFWRTASVDPRRPLAIDRPAVHKALEQWFAAVSQAYAAAAQLKLDKATLTASGNRLDEAVILERYASSFRVVNVARFVASEAGFLDQRYQWL